MEETEIVLVKCEVCAEIIGKVDMKDFEPPLHGSMFMSKNTRNGYPPPFHPSLTWEDLRCPYCNKRPFYSKYFLTNEQDERVGYIHVCDICNKGLKNPLALAGHRGHCIRKN